MIKAVIFDMDGLMFDTERIALKTWQIAGEEFGIHNGGELPNYTFGRNKKGIISVVHEICGEDFPAEKFFDRVYEITDEYIEKNGLPVKEGLYELIDYIKENHLLSAVATSTNLKRTERNLKMANLTGKFEKIVTGDMVENGKPDPEIFLKASSGLNLKPEECIVLEDSANGINAAYNGGFIKFMIPDFVLPTEDTLKKLDGKGKSLLDVIPFLNNCNK